MGKHATIGTSQVGHKNTTLKQASKLGMMARVYAASKLASDVTTEKFAPLPEINIPRANPFTGINPIAGQDFTQVGNNTYKLRVREGFIGLRRVTVKPKDGKAFGVWVASYAGRELPLLSNKGQALGFAESKDKLFALLISDGQIKRPARITPADRKPKAERVPAHYREFTVCQVTLEPARVCDHCNGH